MGTVELDMAEIKKLDIDKIFNENNNPNILFSPGHPSQPDYINFEERGKVFTELIDKKINESR